MSLRYLSFTDEGKIQELLLGQLISHEEKNIYLSQSLQHIKMDQMIKYTKFTNN